MKKGLVITGGCLIALMPLIVLAATVYTLMLPNIYSSSVRISVSEDAPEINPFSDQQQFTAYNPYFLRTQFEVIQSQLVLYEVINGLNLQREWGRNGEPLPREVALKILQNSIQVFQQRDTSLLVISVKRENPDEAATIANELAYVYRDSRLDAALKAERHKIELIEQTLKDQLQRVEAAEAVLHKICEQLDQAPRAKRSDFDGLELQQLEHDRLGAHKEMLVKEGLLQVLKGLEGKEVREQAAFITFDETIINTLRQLQDVSVQLTMLKSDSDADQQDVKRYAAQQAMIEELLAEQIHALHSRLDTERAIAKNKFENLNIALTEIRSETSARVQSSKYRPVRNAQAELETERFIYNQLKAKHRQEIITLEVPRNPVEIIDVAEPNRHPVSPNLFLNVLISVVFAAFFGLPGVVLLILGLKKR